MTSKELELLETLAAISRVSKDLALKLAVMAAKTDAGEEQKHDAHCARPCGENQRRCGKHSAGRTK